MFDELTRGKELYREFMVLLRPWEKRMFRQLLRGEELPLRREWELYSLLEVFANNRWKEDRVRAAAAEAAAG